MLFFQWLLLIWTLVRLFLIMVMQGESVNNRYSAWDLLLWMIGGFLLIMAGAFDKIF